LAYLSVLLFPNSCMILFCKFYFLPSSVHAQTNVIIMTKFLKMLSWICFILDRYHELNFLSKCLIHFLCM
jgi:hypothetical protein